MLSERPRLIYYFLLLSAVLMLTNTLKTSYHEARPFWDNPNIQDLAGCSTQFGNPSGHSLTSFAFALAVWLDYNNCSEKFEASGSVLGKLWMRIIMLVLAVAFSVSVAYSRFVLGMHSMNQLLFGMLLGIWLAFSFHFIGY